MRTGRGERKKGGERDRSGREAEALEVAAGGSDREEKDVGVSGRIASASESIFAVSESIGTVSGRVAAVDDGCEGEGREVRIVREEGGERKWKS